MSQGAVRVNEHESIALFKRFAFRSGFNAFRDRLSEKPRKSQKGTKSEESCRRICVSFVVLPVSRRGGLRSAHDHGELMNLSMFVLRTGSCDVLECCSPRESVGLKGTVASRHRLLKRAAGRRPSLKRNGGLRIFYCFEALRIPLGRCNNVLTS